MLSVVTFKWKPRLGYRSAFGAHHVNVMRSMVERHYQDTHRFICVTDDAKGIDPRVEIVPLWNDHASLPNPSFRDGPSCYRRLKVFSKDIGQILGERFVCIDLDMLITSDLRPLWNRTEDFIAWKNPHPMWPYNGSMFMLTAGTRADVWESFDPKTSPAKSNAAGCRGSDQGWMSYILPKNEATWDRADGVWSYQDEILGRQRINGRLVLPLRSSPLPRNAKVVAFHGRFDPWKAETQRMSPWVAEHYR